MPLQETTPLPKDFVIDNFKSAGNAHSGHDVSFGQLDGRDVAVKPFNGTSERTLESSRNKAEHELRMYRIVHSLGFHTLQPIEVIDEDNVAFLITEWTPNLISGTSFDLTRPLDDKAKGKSGAEVVSAITGVLGQLHGVDITHGDAKLRNFSFHRITGEGPYVVDLEGAQRHKSKNIRGREFFDNAVRNDLRSITYNVGQNGLGAGLSENERDDIFSDLLIAPYVQNNPDRIQKSAIENALLSYRIGVEKFKEVDHKYTS